MIVKSVLGLVFIVAVLALFIAMRPSHFRITRAATMLAAPSAVFPHVNDFHKWQAWSPWERLDSAMKKSYEGPPAGVGAVYRWSGNGQVGEGSTTITESKPNELIRIRLQFIRPFACDNPVEFTFRPQGKETLVTWNMSGKYSFITKAMGLVINMDKMSGDQFEKGLANLKGIVEQAAS